MENNDNVSTFLDTQDDQEADNVSRFLGNQDNSKFNLERAAQKNPDEQAKAIDIAETRGLTADVVASDMRTYEGRQVADSIDLEGFDYTKQFMQTQDNADVGVDDTDNLKGSEDILSTKRLGYWDSVRQGILDDPRYQAANRATTEFMKVVGGAMEFVGGWGEETGIGEFKMPTGRGGIVDVELNTKLKEWGQDVQSFYQEQQLESPVSFEELVEDPTTGKAADVLIAETPKAAGWMAAAAMNSVVMLGGIANDIINTRAENNERDEPDTEDRVIGTFTAVPIAFLDRLGLTSVLKGAPKDWTLEGIKKAVTELSKEGAEETLEIVGKKAATQYVAKEATKGYATETLTEGTQGGLEYLAGSLGTDKGFDSHEFLMSMGAEAFIGGPVGGGVRTVTATGEAFAGVERAKVKQERAEQLSVVEQAEIDELIELSTDSKTRERKSDRYNQFIKSLDSEKEVHLSAEGVQEAIDAGAVLPTSVTDQLNDSGVDVVVDMPTFMSDIAPNEEVASVLRPHMRMSSETYTQTEAEEGMGQDTLKSMMEKAVYEKEEVTKLDSIKEDYEGQLVATKRISPDQAREAAGILGARIKTAAAEQNLSVEEVAQRLGVSFAGPEFGAEAETQQIVDQSIAERVEEGELKAKILNQDPISQEEIDFLRDQGLLTDADVTTLQVTEEVIEDEIQTDRPQLQTGENARTASGRVPRESWASTTAVVSEGTTGVEPRTVFRGSKSGVVAAEDFQNLGAATGNPNTGLGVWFSSSNEDASTYGPNVGEQQLDIQNPKVYGIEEVPAFDSIEESVAFAEDLKTQGHDGIIFDYRDVGGPVHFVVFDADQVITTAPTVQLNQGPTAIVGADGQIEIKVGLSTAINLEDPSRAEPGRDIPGLSKLFEEAKTDPSAAESLNAIARDSLDYLLGGNPSVGIEYVESTGYFGTSTEPSLNVKITFNPSDRNGVLAGLKQFANNFIQDEVHVRERPDAGTDFGHEYDDGSYNTQVYTLELKSSMTPSEIKALKDAADLYGLSATEDAITLYFVGDPKDETSYTEFEEGAARAAEYLQSTGKAQGFHAATERLWPYGSERTPYEQIKGDLRVSERQRPDSIQRIAARLAGRDVKPVDQAPDITPEQRTLQEGIAEAYDAMPINDLSNPQVRRAYDELAAETIRQFNALPIKVVMKGWDQSIDIDGQTFGAGEPYSNSNAMRDDVFANNRLVTLATDDTAFGPEGVTYDNHPLLANTGQKDVNGYPLLVNDMFRAIHDYYAHTLAPTQFGPKGEEAAWKNHMAMTSSPWARWALTTETRGQNSWVNFRPEVEDVPIPEREFAVQKVGLLPIDMAMTGDPNVDDNLQRLKDQLESPKYFNQPQAVRNEIGLYSGVEQATIDLKLPGWKKEDGVVGGKEIFAKIKKTPGIKQEELQWLGLEEYLTADPKGKFTRDEVLSFVKANGVVITESIGDIPAGEEMGEFSWSESVIEDEEYWKHRVDDYMYDFNRGAVDEWMLEPFMDTWVVKSSNMQSVVELIEDPDQQKIVIGELNNIGNNMGKLSLIYSQFDRDELVEMSPGSMEKDFEAFANERAEAEYMDNPEYKYEDETTGYTIVGSDDMGYSLDRGDGQGFDFLDAYSFGEAEIQAQQYAYEDGKFASSEDTQAAHWESYVMDGSYENYRELKLILPEVEGEFREEAHEYPEDNIVTFLRVDDRELIADPEGVDATKTNTYFIDEFQSDWHQQGRQHGYEGAGDRRMDEIAAEIEQLNKETDSVVTEYVGKLGEGFERLTDNVMVATRSFFDVGRRESDFQLKNRLIELNFPFAEWESMVEKSDELRNEEDAVNMQRRQEVPDAPFKGDAWMTMGLKRAIVDAVENDYESLAWPNAKVLMERWSDRYAELYMTQYDTKMPSVIKKLTKQKPVQLDLAGDPIDTSDLPRYEVVEDSEYEGRWLVLKDGETDDILDTEAKAIKSAKDGMKQDKIEAAEEGYWIIPLTDELKAKVKSEAFTLFQDPEPEAQKPRGTIHLMPDNQRIIQLREASDASTFIHEGGHLFLEFERQLSEEFGVTQDQITLLEWLGVESFDDIEVDQHEQFARGFEAYLYEGKAPSLSLRRTFESFKRWMVNVYKSLAELNVELTDDVRGVFDRMLATQAEIEEATSNPAYDEFFRSKEQAGMTDEEWEKYQKQLQRAKDKTTQSVDKKLIDQYRRKKSAEWKEEKAPLLQEERERLEKEPVYQVMSDAAGYPMDYEMLMDIMDWDKMPGRFIGKAKKEGVDPQEYAEVYGWSSVNAMVKDILNAQPLAKAIDEAAEARMVDKYGDILNDGTIEQEVRDALHNEEQAKVLEQEIKALGGKRKTDGINRELLKANAREMISAMTFKEIQPSKFYRQELKAAQNAARATSPEEVLKYKTQQIVNHYLYREAVDTKDKMMKQRKYIRGVQGREYNTKMVNPEYVQNMKVLANMYDLRTNVERVDATTKILEWYQAQISDPNQYVQLELLDETLIKALDAKQDGQLMSINLPQFDELTASQLRGIHDQLKHMRFIGGQMSEEGRAEFEADVMKLADSINEKGGRNVSRTKGVPREGEALRRSVSHMVNKLPSLRNLVRKLDGFAGDEGVAHDMIYREVEKASSNKIRIASELYDRFREELDKVYEIGLNRKDVKEYRLESGTTITMHPESRFMMALYWGTDSSRDAIRDGFGVTDDDVFKILSDMTPAQLNMVNNVWKVNETMWPELSKASVQLYGVAPPKLDPTPYEVNGVMLNGGHMRLFYDSQEIELKGAAEEAGKMQTIMPTKAGSLHSRVGSGGRPPLLDRNNILRAMDDNSHFTAFAETGRRIAGLMNAKDVRNAIEAKHGEGFNRAIIENLENITAARTQRESIPALGALLKLLRKAATFKYLAYSIRNTVQQVGALPVAAEEVGTPQLIGAITRFATPSMHEEFKAFVNERSEFMSERASLVNREAAEYLKKVSIDSKTQYAWQKFGDYGFTPQTITDSAIAYPTWMAKYEQKMGEHGDEAKAASQADTAVAESVGSGSDLHLGGAFQSNQSELVRTMTLFGTWFNAYYQRIYKSSAGFTDFNGQTAKAMITTPFITAIISQLVIMDYPDEDSEETWWSWMFENYVGFMAGTVPLLRDVVGTMTGFGPKTLLSGAIESTVGIAGEIDAYWEGRQSGIKATADVGKAVTGVIPVPGSGNLWRVMDFIDSNERGLERGNPIKKSYQALVEGPDRNK